MKEVLTVSPKGQITLPAAMRQALGLKGQGQVLVTAETRDGRIVLSPAMVVETEMWNEADVAAWNAADTFVPGEQDALRAALARSTGRD